MNKRVSWSLITLASLAMAGAASLLGCASDASGAGKEGLPPDTDELDGGTAQADGSVPASPFDNLIPGPQQAGFDPELAALISGFDKQFHTFNAAPFGLSLDAYIPLSSDRELVAAFLAQNEESDFSAYTSDLGTPRTATEIVSTRGEYGDLGMFGGVAAAGDAFRYMVLRDHGGDADGVEVARNNLIDAINAFHIAATIIGTPGTVARGIRQKSDVGSPPTTHDIPNSCPSPADREDRWREDGSGLYPDWIYADNNSKDQMIGYVMALGTFWDAIADDPTIDDALRDQLQGDALALAHSLMTEVEILPGVALDLVIRDWNGCSTEHFDLNPRIVPGDPVVVLPEEGTLQNGWGALAALGIIRTLYHITGDEDVGAFYYDELIGARDYPTMATTGLASVSAMYVHACFLVGCVSTNFSNVNMAFVSAYGILRYETDPALRSVYRGLLSAELWDTGKPLDGIEIQQSWFDMLYTAFRDGGPSDVVLHRAMDQLRNLHPAPYFSDYVENCDAAEIEAGQCIAVDGTTVIDLDEIPGRGGATVSLTPLPITIRPPDNFEWRSDPRRVNGGLGVNMLNPGGEFRVVYWMGRHMLHGESDSNVSPVARLRP